MENENALKEKVYLEAKAQSLQSQLDSLKEENKKKQKLMEELYEVIYHKGAWLTLSDENIEGLKKVVDKIKARGDSDSSENTMSLITSLEIEKTWGI